MEKTSRIKIGDLPGNQKITREEMRKITGGWKFTWAGIYEIGSAPDGDSPMDDSFLYIYNKVSGEVTFY